MSKKTLFFFSFKRGGKKRFILKLDQQPPPERKVALRLRIELSWKVFSFKGNINRSCRRQ
ncbi:hypothetical protein AB834_02885 [PVC group bacterium (ex Bugula neritina AB1)]|nr:hypothetical protein AB834_02885 [PVC group bacterium (ex Bugula neritina AB1)]